MTSLCYRRHRFPPEIIQHAIWLYLRLNACHRPQYLQPSTPPGLPAPDCGYTASTPLLTCKALSQPHDARPVFAFGACAYRCRDKAPGRHARRNLDFGVFTPMRIAQIAPLHEAVPPKLYGGTERVVSYLTEELLRSGTQ